MFMKDFPKLKKIIIGLKLQVINKYKNQITSWY